MTISVYTGPLAWATGAGTAVAATTTETSLLTGVAATGKWPMPGGFFNMPGQGLRIWAAGQVSTPAATQGNVTFKVKIGAVAVATSATFTSLANLTNISWELNWWLRLRAVGDATTGNFYHNGNFLAALVSATNLNNLLQATAPVVGTGFDVSTAAALDLTVTWSNATAGNTIALHDYLLEATP